MPADAESAFETARPAVNAHLDSKPHPPLAASRFPGPFRFTIQTTVLPSPSRHLGSVMHASEKYDLPRHMTTIRHWARARARALSITQSQRQYFRKESMVQMLYQRLRYRFYEGACWVPSFVNRIERDRPTGPPPTIMTGHSRGRGIAWNC